MSSRLGAAVGGELSKLSPLVNAFPVSFLAPRTRSSHRDTIIFPVYTVLIP